MIFFTHTDTRVHKCLGTPKYLLPGMFAHNELIPVLHSTGNIVRVCSFLPTGAVGDAL